MPSNNNTANQELYGMLHSNGFDPTPLDASGDDAGLPEKADVFQVMTKNGSPVTVTITSDRILRVYYSEKSTKDAGWNTPDGLLHKLRGFVRQHRLAGFEPEKQNDNKNLKYDMAKRAEMKQEELSLNEGYYPMGKRASYNDGIPTVKIVIQHTRQLGEGEQRFRNVEKIFIENADGERFRSPTNSPGLSKVFARLIAEGDKPHGEHWNHLVSLVEDYTKLRGFVRATKNGVFNEGAQQWVEAGSKHYSELRESLRSLMTGRGYRAYFESWTPTLNESSDEGGVDLTEMFQTSVLDARVEAALPIIKRLGVVVEAKLESSLEEWAGQVERDAVYGVEDREMVEEGCDCGPDCDCPDCQEHNAPVKKNKKRLAVRESKVDIKLIESEFGPIQYKGGVFSRNQQLFKHLIEHFGNNDTRATNAFMYIVNQKIESDYKLPLSEEIKEDDSILTDIFDSFEQLSGDHQYKAGDKVVALEISAMPFGKPKEVWIEGSYTPLTIEEMTPTHVVFTNGHQRPVKRLVQLRLWNELVLFDSPQSAEKAVSWMLLKAGQSDDWTLKEYIDRSPVDGLEEGYGEDRRGGRYGKIGSAKATPVKSNLTPGQRAAGQVSATEPAKPTGKILGEPQKKHPFQDRLVGASESADDPLQAIRRLIGRK